ncbi:sensor histidine kinase [Cognatiluteimonas telluris]|jgi:signal transduction histidine kinase|uniref:sensor histidine kinase n=1 Tax=Cognatiluteimonas telluris TaxID=1104775 RepID=UPI0014083D7B|nr:HAMP domain-containing sensor histidine kinase [Lysobacter telluris]
MSDLHAPDSRSTEHPGAARPDGAPAQHGAGGREAQDAGAAAGAALAGMERELAQARAELTALRLEQATLAHGLSHDLRAPLRAIDTFSALVQADGSLAPATRAHVARVRAAANRMGGLIDALLELSRANRAELHAEVVDLGLLVECAVALHQEAEPGREARLELDPGLLVEGDERLLRLLVSHLVGNAWKFSRERDCVRIRATGQRVGDRLQLEFQDRGCGFDMRYVDKIFQPFQRLAGSEQGGGHGLGLAVAQRVVERHGGRLHAHAEPGEGCCLRFDLAAAAPA